MCFLKQYTYLFSVLAYCACVFPVIIHAGSLFFALTLIGLLVAKNIFKILTSNAFQEDIIPPAFLIAFVFFAPYLGLWKAWRNKHHLDYFIRKNEIMN